MSNELTYALMKFNTALQRLKDAVGRASDDLDRDGVIQRFEFTFELFWKAIRYVLEHEGFECIGPRSCIKEGARRGLVADGEILLDMLEDRNRTSHIYDEATAAEIFEKIREQYIGLMERNNELFTKYLASEG